MGTIVSIDPHDPSPATLEEAAAILRAGGVIAFPTDTLYGLAADPRSGDAVKRLYAVKEREARFAVPLIAGDLAQARQAGEFTPADLALAGRFWPGPLSLVVRPAAALSQVLLGEGQSVAIRVPAHPVARALAAAFGFAITATSANLSGRPPESTAAGVADALGTRVDLVIDAGATPGGPPSTIVELTAEGPRLLRAGAIPFERVLESGE